MSISGGSASRLAVCAVWLLCLLALLPAVVRGCDWSPQSPSAASSLSYDRSALRLLVNASAALPASSSFYIDFTRSDCHHCASTLVSRRLHLSTYTPRPLLHHRLHYPPSLQPLLSPLNLLCLCLRC